MSDVNRLDESFIAIVKSISSDTASAEDMCVKLRQHRSAITEHWKRDLFDDVVFDTFMIYTETQRRRRLSGELDNMPWRMSSPFFYVGDVVAEGAD